MKPFKVKKQAGGEHYKIFVRSKLPIPKAPLRLFTKVHEPPVRWAGSLTIKIEE